MMKSAFKNNQVEDPDEEMRDFSEENAHEISRSFEPLRFPKPHCSMTYTLQFPYEEVLEAYNIRVKQLVSTILLEASHIVEGEALPMSETRPPHVLMI